MVAVPHHSCYSYMFCLLHHAIELNYTGFFNSVSYLPCVSQCFSELLKLKSIAHNSTVLPLSTMAVDVPETLFQVWSGYLVSHGCDVREMKWQ